MLRATRATLALTLVLVLQACAGAGAALFGLDVEDAVAVSQKRQEVHAKLAASWSGFLNNPKVSVPADVKAAYLKGIEENLANYEDLAAAQLAWLDEVADGILTGDGIDWRKAWDALRQKLREQRE